MEESSTNLQVKFMDLIRQRTQPGSSLAYELADLLNISTDSVYRRLRGETTLSLEEISLLCSHYHISLDMLNESSPGMVAFRYSMLDKPENFRRHWISMLNDLKSIHASERG